MIAAPTIREAPLQELLGLACHSYLAYVVESSSPVVVDETDRKLMALFRELLDKERYYVERAYELLEKARFRPLTPTFAIKDSNFNFLRPVKLAEHAIEHIGTEIARLSALKGRIAPDDPSFQEFQRLVDDFLALRREELRRITELRATAAAPAVPAPPAASAAAVPPAARA